MTTDKGVALSRLLFWSVVLLVSLGLSLPLITSPVLADSDQDGLSDTFEIAFGTDPDESDSDDDNLSDWDEIYIYGTDPTNPDTDGDGTPDDEDEFPLDDGDDVGGRTTPSQALTSNLARCPVPLGPRHVGVSR